MKSTVVAAAVLISSLPVCALAVEAHHPPAAAGVASSAPLAEGEVRKVDRDAKKITIRHGPIPNLDMPAMTMVFQVKDAALLEAARPGDKIRFAAEKSGGAYVVTRIEPVK
ncbi:MAG TPA: copper-binding protein [Burkholderiales bacterium]|nr:copper-binding protein [Burkholderiales bacterium]